MGTALLALSVSSAQAEPRGKILGRIEAGREERIVAVPESPPETFTFPSADGLQITADLYAPHVDEKSPMIVLFHQAGWSRGEYKEIASRLNRLGFNCLAVDQRSGGEVNGVENETAKRASLAGKGTTYTDALPDMEAAVKFARGLTKGPLLAWGSSYSAALVLKIVGDGTARVDGVLSFSPGEYFERMGKPADWIARSASKIDVPVFITSGRGEKRIWAAIYDAIPGGRKVSYLPVTGGNHGSRALWSEFDDSDGYWKAVTAFLEPFLEK